MTITLSSKNGIKQYSLPDSIKKIILFLVLFIALVIGGISYYVTTLTKEVNVLKEKNVEIEKQLQAKLHLQELEKIEKLAREKKRKERIAQALKEQKESEAQAKREEEQRLAKLKAEKIKQEKLALEKKKQEALAKAKKEKEARLAKEKAERLKKEKLAREKKKEKERLAKLKAEKLKKERLAKAKKEKAKKAKLAAKKKKANQLPKIAKSKLGKRYVWGATGPKTFDCSGFTSYIYRKKGINIPRTSRQQSKYGKLVSRKHLQPGDLVFFDTSRQAKGIINHVGMYIGNNKFIHASSAKKRVIITSLNSAFYKRRYKWARRVLN